MYEYMKVKDLKKFLNSLDKEHDELFIVTSADDEGNRFRTVGNGIFTTVEIDEPGDYLEPDVESLNINAIIIG